MAAVFADLHRDNGVDLRCEVTVAAIRPAQGDAVGGRERRARRRHAARRGRGRGRASGSRRTSSSRGRPASRSTTASSSTRSLRTSDADVFAAGDVAQRRAPGAGPAHPRGALGERAEPAGGRRAVHAGRRRRVRPAALLLHRPVRPRHGVPRLRRARTTRSWSTATSTKREFVALWHARRARGGRDERQRLGRHRPDPRADPVRQARGRVHPARARRPRRAG